jgi:TetR/AcrR family transcriptional regulator
MTNEINSQERMMAAAVHLFSRSGYHGITTKEVSKLANVSESNIFRYYPTKRDLFLGAIEHALAKVTGHGDALMRVFNANDAHTALLSVFELISETAVQHPELVRLLHFSAMEFEPDMEPLFRQHVRPYVECLSNSIRRWSREGRSWWRETSGRVPSRYWLRHARDAAMPLNKGAHIVCAFPMVL